ncbi:hypothetical protein HHI36_011706 [Cryptolaemus montrouzieri]|uniref:Coiled-coil domain-containing protein 134 n=1 Tax=Cryptolaemus montrouzieri TaxID=559131 RepID=A0ABD2MMF4_9CUCU
MHNLRIYSENCRNHEKIDFKNNCLPIMYYIVFYIISPILVSSQGLDSSQLAEELCILLKPFSQVRSPEFKYSQMSPHNETEDFPIIAIDKQLFKRQRVEHLEAVKAFKKISNYEKQSSMIEMMAEKVFSSIQDNRALIEASPFIPGVSEFPSDEKIREALSSILENTALFSEIIIRYPDLSTAALKTNNNWDILLQWGIAFCNQMRYLLDKSTVKLLHLVSQELNHIDRDPNYINPIEKQKIFNRQKMKPFKK